MLSTTLLSTFPFQTTLALVAVNHDRDLALARDHAKDRPCVCTFGCISAWAVLFVLMHIFIGFSTRLQPN